MSNDELAYLRGTFASSLQFNTFFHFAAQRVKIGPVMISLNIGKVTLLVADSLASKCQDVQQSQVGIGLECMRRWSLLEHNSVTRPDTALPAKMHKTNKTEKVAFFITKSELLHFSPTLVWSFVSFKFGKTNFVFLLFWISLISSIWRVFRKRLDFDSPNIATLIWLSRNLSQRPFSRFTSATRWMNDGMQEDKRLNKLMPKTPYHCRIGKL